MSSIRMNIRHTGAGHAATHASGAVAATPFDASGA
jgi:hypothetical protein